jgi:hypothetical protein
MVAEGDARARVLSIGRSVASLDSLELTNS